MDDEEYEHATLEMALSIPTCETCDVRMKPAYKGWKCAGCGAEQPYA